MAKEKKFNEVRRRDRSEIIRFRNNVPHGLIGLTMEEAIRCVVWGNLGKIRIYRDGQRTLKEGTGDFTVRAAVDSQGIVRQASECA